MSVAAFLVPSVQWLQAKEEWLIRSLPCGKRLKQMMFADEPNCARLRALFSEFFDKADF